MAEADFEIDFYGDAGNEEQHDKEQVPEPGQSYQDEEAVNGTEEQVDGYHPTHDDPSKTIKTEETESRQGTKRKSEEDDRPIDPTATSAVMISELNWWITDDDIRGWLRTANCEGDVKDLTFSEHKVNGKSKGQAYIEFYSPQAATAAKHHIDGVTGENGPSCHKKVTTSYWNPGMNPFRTLPKDAPARVKEQPRAAPSGPYTDRGNYSGGFRGRGTYGTNRGGMNQNNFNRNYGQQNTNTNMGYNQNSINNNNNNNTGMVGMGGFNGNMGNAGGNFGFNNRGNNMMGGMRGNQNSLRGGRGNNMMGGMPMGMSMGMPSMNMGMMGNNMSGFQGMGNNFNGGFSFGQNQGIGGGGGAGASGGANGGGDWGNPHGAKRPRPE